MHWKTEHWSQNPTELSLQCSWAMQFSKSCLLFISGREGKSTSVLAVLWFCSEDIACCFHYCTLDLHMQEKVECLTHHNQLRVFANLKYRGMGEGCASQPRGLSPLLCSVCEMMSCGCVDVCLRACQRMDDCACVLFILVGKDLKCKLLFIISECDVKSSHSGGGGR